MHGQKNIKIYVKYFKSYRKKCGRTKTISVLGPLFTSNECNIQTAHNNAFMQLKPMIFFDSMISGSV